VQAAGNIATYTRSAHQSHAPQGNVILVSSEHGLTFDLTKKEIGFDLDSLSRCLYGAYSLTWI
jgi:hypothetical protein